MTKRYYCPTLLDQGTVVSLDESEAVHATRVMRVSVGDAVAVFDGLGNEAKGEITTANRKDCTISVADIRNVDREPAVMLTLAIALPKPDRAKEMIERLTEIGVRRVRPIVCQRTQRPPPSSLIDKLRRVAIEACKQSQRNLLMQIDAPASFADVVTESPGDCGLSIFAHPGGKPIGLALDQYSGTSIRAAIGPEGGLTNDETACLLEAGFTSVGLGDRILRIETAAAVVAAKLLV